ncbi:MAG: sulfatase, partial [Planctomycetota bacterium]
MKRTTTLTACLLMILTSFSEACGAEHARPNLVVLLADDHSAVDSSVYGEESISTPHLDRMAAAGMVFERAFVNSPSCAPSRAALFTGMYPARNGAEANHSKPHHDIRRMPAYLKVLGYEVVSFGKTSHYGHVKDQGFDLAIGFEYHNHACVEECINFLKSRKSDRPLELFFGTHRPHVPLPEAETIDPTTVHIRPMYVDTPEFRQYRARYVNAVKKMDEEIGAVYAAAKEVLGSANTMFLQTSDHGSQLPFGKWNLYDDGIRVPLIVHWEGKVAAGSRTKSLVQWMDILPTLIEVAEGSVPDRIDGKSFLTVLRNADHPHRDAIFATHTGDGSKNVYPCRSMRTSRWHYIRNLHPEFRYTTHIDRVQGPERDYWLSWEKAAKSDPEAARIVARYRQRPAHELYDLDADPFELNNLAENPNHADRLQEMSAALNEWMKSTGDAQLAAGKPSLLSEPLPPA